MEEARPGKAIKRSGPLIDENIRKQKYEKKTWQDGRKWLVHDEALRLNKMKIMFCSWCKQHNVDGKFTTGNDNFKLDTVRQHENSKLHKFYAARFADMKLKMMTARCHRPKDATTCTKL